MTTSTSEKPLATSVESVGVKIDGLCKSFADLEVLRNVSFEVEPGEIFAIMGPSGSGKSVLLKHVAGLEQPTSGEVTVNGIHATSREFREKIHLALVFQAGALFNSMTVFDNLALYPREHRLHDEKTIAEKVHYTLGILGLHNTAEKLPAELSGGMKKRVAIARALVVEPQLILYDEPTSELDPTMGATISEIIADLRKELGVTSLVVSHDRDLCMTISDRVAILMNGEVLALGTPAEIKQSDDKRIHDFLNPVIDLENPRFKQNSTS